MANAMTMKFINNSVGYLTKVQPDIALSERSLRQIRTRSAAKLSLIQKILRLFRDR
ncbi:hypothetical protein [Leptolyngbya sp. FACHB-17]|uniref:hypothetical protein n=1 Tax=unclassified Leptolyngbya TaxID=2650499 RepID=UPI0016813F70|nr:hypothetical protein [Leptolyngbya sp. FACHB-17]MBD2082279.1 hypothetical protein [Leptolyngbya sp. FACHB-17]